MKVTIMFSTRWVARCVLFLRLQFMDSDESINSYPKRKDEKKMRRWQESTGQPGPDQN
jgi:hypothetical protein